VRGDETLIPKGDKKAMQRVMPFLQWVAAEVRNVSPAYHSKHFMY